MMVEYTHCAKRAIDKCYGMIPNAMPDWFHERECEIIDMENTVNDHLFDHRYGDVIDSISSKFI
jgi:hypothetical protein